MENEIKHIHSFTSTVVPPTCINNGYTLHKCECGYEHKDSFLPQTDHSYTVTESTPPTCTVAGTSKYVCTVCGEEKALTIAPTGHKWGEWNTSAFATCTEDGSQFRICSQCGQIEEQTIAAKGHNLTNPQKSETEKGMIDYFCTSCGQTVTMPSTRMKLLKLPFKKKIALTAAAIILIAIILCMKPFILPGYHYISAKILISTESYEKAYYHLKECEEIENAKILLTDFQVAYEKTITYYYDDDGNQSSKNISYHNDNGDEIYSESYYGDFDEVDYEYKYEYKYEYNDNGNLIKKTQYDKDGDISEITTYEYFDDGYSIHDIYYTNYKENIKLIENITEYNTFGQVTHRISDYPNIDRYFETEYEYDKEGKTIQAIHFNKDGEKTGVTTYQYNDDGDMETSITKNNDGTTSKTEYKYNTDGNLIETSTYNDGTTSKTEYKYNTDGNLIETSTYNDGKLSHKTKYDDNGNLTETTHYDAESGKPSIKFEYKNPFVVYLPKR